MKDRVEREREVNKSERGQTHMTVYDGDDMKFSKR
jgi:hypothetical protein